MELPILGEIEFSAPLTEGFWDEWEDWDYGIYIAYVISMLMVLFIFFIITLPTELQRGTIYAIMLIFAAIISTFDIAAEKVFKHGEAKQSAWLLQWVNYGGSKQQAIFALLVGGALGMWLTNAGQSIGTPLFGIGTAQPSIGFLGGAAAAFIYICIIAPYCEEKFFRGLVMPTANNLYRLLGGGDNVAGIAALLTQAGFFGAMHYVAYGANPTMIQSAIVFGIIAGTGNYMLRSVCFGLGLHVINNYVAFTRIFGG